jgi:hypothetical protein
MGYLSSIFGGGGLEVFGICQLPLHLGNFFSNFYFNETFKYSINDVIIEGGKRSG